MRRVYAKLTAAAAPHVAHVKDILIACYGRVVEHIDELKARWLKARDNVVGLIKKFKEAGAPPASTRPRPAASTPIATCGVTRREAAAAYSREYCDSAEAAARCP